MYRYQTIDNPEDQIRLLEKLGSAEPAANASGSADHLFLSVSADGEAIGVIRGWFLPESQGFQILMILILPQLRSESLLRDMVVSLLDQADRRYHPKEYFWKYTIKTGRSDPFLRLVEGIPGIETHSDPPFHRFRVHLIGFHNRADNYSDSYLEKNGYRILHSHDLSPEMKAWLTDRIHAEDAENDLLELHPFVEEYDESASLFLQDKETGALCGWVICRLIAPKTLEVRRWYTFPDRRAKMAGIYLIGLWIKSVSGPYTDIEFRVQEDHKAVLKFHRWYFGEALEELFCEKTLRMERRLISAS